MTKVPYTDLLQSSNVVSCAMHLIIIQQGLNPILNQYDYPELQVRIGIDFGEIGVSQYGVDIDELDGKAVFTRPHIDMIGSTISVAVKMTSTAKPDHIVIGEKLYNKLKKKQKEIFKEITGPSSVENYIDEISEGHITFTRAFKANTGIAEVAVGTNSI